MVHHSQREFNPLKLQGGAAAGGGATMAYLNPTGPQIMNILTFISIINIAWDIYEIRLQMAALMGAAILSFPKKNCHMDS